MLDCLEIPHFEISKDIEYLSDVINNFTQHLKNGQSVAFVIRKDSLINGKKVKYESDVVLSREDALKTIISATDTNAVYVCTTGKLSREIFEIREQNGEGHSHDFLTVGSMGHSLMIAYGIALAKPNRRIYCLDGDGAVLMHMGSLAIVGTSCPKNLIHIVINNGAHETVGGLPTVSNKLNLSDVARSLGYSQTFRVTSLKELEDVLCGVNNTDRAIFIEVICNLSSRSDLGRPTTTPIQNKKDLMAFLAERPEEK